MNRFRIDWRLGMVGTVVFVALGCAAPDRHLTPGYGDAYREAFAGQVSNPAAPDDPAPVKELPGEVATQIYEEKYVESLLTEPETEPSVSQQIGEIR